MVVVTPSPPPAGGRPAPQGTDSRVGEVMALGPARVRCTGRAEGDLRDPVGDNREVLARRARLVDRPWTWLRQIHAADVVLVDTPGGEAGRPADAAVTATAGTALAVITADCAPVALASPEGVIGVAHAGWRGLAAGVIEQTVAAMRALGAGTVQALLGPCIHVECYAFGPGDLDALAVRLGESVRGITSHGQAALDIPAAVRRALARSGAELVDDVGVCTACSPQHWSWRAGHDLERQATVVWVP